MRFNWRRSYRKLIVVLQRNKLLMFAFFCSCVYSLVLGKLLLHQQTFMNPDLSTPIELTGLSKQVPKSTKSELQFATFLPMLDAFNPFVLQTFSRNLGEQLSCRGDVYGVLRKRRLYLSGGHFQELSYRGLERNRTRGKVYVVGETADENGITLGFQGVIQHSSGKCVHPNKPFILEGVGLVFYIGCEDSANRLVYVWDKKGRWLNSDRTMCVQPKDGLVDPPNRTPLEFSKSCGKASIFRSLSNGAIQHVTSGMCVHPYSGTAKPEDDDLLVLYDGCHFSKLKFSMLNARSIETVSIRATQHRVNNEMIKVEILLASDTIKEIKTEYHVQVVEKLDVLKRHPRATKRAGQFDVLLIMFGSMSFANFQRTMPRVYEFLRSDLKSVIFPGFSLVGEGEFAQIKAVLAGTRLAELRNEGKGQHPWLFKMFQDSGYVTMATQDRLASGELRKIMNKFGSSTVDHYLDALWEKVYRNGQFDESALCHGSQFPFNISLSYLNSFLDSYRNHPKFALMLNSALTSLNFNTAKYAERPLLQFLKRKKRKLLKNTVLVIFGNHGWRGNGLRDTAQGKLEERLPFLSITMPTAFREKYPEKFQDMVSNSHLLTSPLDIHATLRDLLKFSKKSGTNTTQNTTEIQGQSLFTKWDPNSRNCTSLGIPEHWCPCVRAREVNASESNLNRISEVILENLNYILKDAPSGVCRKLYFKDLVSFKMLKILSKVRRYRTSESAPNCPFCKPIFWKSLPKTKDVIYQVDIRVQPGERVYRTMVNLIQNDMYIEVKPRLILGTPANCTEIKDNPTADYCECIERF